MSDEADVVRSIAFAIGKTALSPRSRIAADNDRDRAIAAQAILDHLKLSGYTITKKAEDKPHSIP